MVRTVKIRYQILFKLCMLLYHSLVVILCEEDEKLTGRNPFRFENGLYDSVPTLHAALSSVYMYMNIRVYIGGMYMHKSGKKGCICTKWYMHV